MKHEGQRMALIFVLVILFDFLLNNINTKLNKCVFLNSMVLCFALVPRTMDFHWYRDRIQKFWYSDNTSLS